MDEKDIPKTVDRLKRVREQIAQLESEEQTLTLQIKMHMAETGLTVLEGNRAVARLDSRAVHVVDIPSFVRACGGLKHALPALKCSVEKAREILSGRLVDSLCSHKKEIILKVEYK